MTSQKTAAKETTRRPNSERSNAPIFTIRVLGAMLACVAGGISRASAFVVVQRSREHEWRSRERIGEESS